MQALKSEPTLHVSPRQLSNITVNVKLSLLPLRTDFTETFSYISVFYWSDALKAKSTVSRFYKGTFHIFYDRENSMDKFPILKKKEDCSL